MELSFASDCRTCEPRSPIPSPVQDPDPDPSFGPQAISNLRATLSNRRYPNDEGQNDDQNIISEQDGHTTILVPSNGYTFSRTPSQVRRTDPKPSRAPHVGKARARFSIRV